MFILYGHTKCLSAVYHCTVNLGKYALRLIFIHRAFSPKVFGNGAGGGGRGWGLYTDGLLACYSDLFKHVSFNISKATRFLHSFHLYMVIQNSNIFVNIRSFKTKYMTKISFLECVY